MARFHNNRSRFFLTVTTLVIIIIGGWLIFRQPAKKLDHPEYLSFVGNYVFSVPKDFAVDESSVEGIQLVVKANIAGKTIDQIYEADNISLQPITFLKDKKGSTFKNYVNNTFVPDAKKVLAPDVTTTFAKVDGWDVARVTVKKAGQPLRFIHLKNGQHPVSIVSKEETDAFKKIEQSVTDVEKTDLKKEVAPIKQAVQNTAQLLRDKNTAELYKQAGSDFRTKTNQADVSKLLEAEAVYSQGAITINGGSYNNNEFGGVINLVPLNKDFKQASGALYFKKINGQWKLTGLQLPNPLINKVQ